MEQSIANFLFQILFAALSAICGWLIGMAKSNRKKKKEEEEAEKKRTEVDEEFRKMMVKALVFLLRCELIRLHDVYTKKGYCSYSMKLEYEEGYEIYHAFGGNGTVTHLKDEIDSLPEGPRPKKEV